MKNLSGAVRGGAHFQTPVAALLAMTMALNILGLSIPLAAQLLFNRVLPSPGSTTLPLLIAGIICIAALEAGLRLSRSVILLNAGRVHGTHMTQQLMARILGSSYDAHQRGAARTLEYFVRIAQLTEVRSGRTLVGAAELAFVPIILFLIYLISPAAGIIVTICLSVGLIYTVGAARRLHRQSNVLRRKSEQRYRFLLTALSAIHPVKAAGMEDHLQRRYENIQSRMAGMSMRASRTAGRMVNGIAITNQAIIASTLGFGAYAVGQNSMSLGAVSATVLLGGRIMGPLQRAVLIFIQMRDVDEAEEVVQEVYEHDLQRAGQVSADIVNEGRLYVANISFETEEPVGRTAYDGISVTLYPGETVALTGGSEAARSKFMRIAAGIEEPARGEVFLNKVPLAEYSRDQLNANVAYVSGRSEVFAGTIRDNITRFGAVSLNDALEVAELLGIRGEISQLADGVETRLNGGKSENIAASLCQQIAIVRTIVLRPKLILFDNVERGLDRQNYARFQRFITELRGQLTMVIASDDLNLTAGARSHIKLGTDGAELLGTQDHKNLTAYRSLSL